MSQPSAGGAVPAAMPRHERSYRVRFDECGPDGLLPASGYLRYAQDLAWLHSAAQGFDRVWYGQRGLNWLIRAIELDVVGEAAYGQELQVATEVLGFRRAWARRRTEVSRVDGGPTLAVALIDWLLLNAEGRPTRVPAELSGRFGVETQATLSPLRVVRDGPPAGAHAAELHVRRSELDPWAHVNNAAYLDYVDELVLAAGDTGVVARLPRRYRVEYLRPAEQGDRLRGHAWPAQRGWSVGLARVDGEGVMRARLEAEMADWAGG